MLYSAIRKQLINALVPVCLPILDGPLKGVKWSIVCGTRFLRGTYSTVEVDFYSAHISAGDTVLDLGGHVGYMSALYAKLVGEQGRVITFEPNPINIKIMRHHIRKNSFDNIQLIPAGVGEQKTTLRFDDTLGSGRGRISDKGGLDIDIVSLDDLYERGELPKAQFLKMDIEGGEIGALKGGRKYLSEARPMMLISTHGPEAHQFVINFLSDLNYNVQIFATSTNRLICKPK